MIDITREYIDEAVRLAETGIPSDLPNIRGFSSPKVRCLLNTLCQIEDANYLEIGVLGGSTFIPALMDNNAKAACIDNWSQFKIGRDVFDKNIAEYLPGRDMTVIEGSMYEVDLNLVLPDINIYFYDGPHDAKGQYEAFSRFDPVFADRFIAIVDDWHWTVEPCRETLRAFADLGYRVENLRTLPAGREVNDPDAWWNGVMVAIVEKGE